jgi:uncharacterized protein YdeI (BOF family)
MRKFSLISAILLLASAWMLAQNSTPPTSSAPSSAQSAGQSAAQDAQQTATQAAKDAGNAVSGNMEGCVGGSAGSYTLTDSSGKTYQLAGDTSSLADHIGHQVKVSGTLASAAGSAAGGTPTITVKKVKMVSATCPNK